MCDLVCEGNVNQRLFVQKNKSEAAYRRQDQLEKRSRLMGDWSKFIYEKNNGN